MNRHMQEKFRLAALHVSNLATELRNAETNCNERYNEFGLQMESLVAMAISDNAEHYCKAGEKVSALEESLHEINSELEGNLEPEYSS